MMEFKIGHTHFGISFGFFAVVALYLVFDRQGIGALALAAIALHECGHIAAMHLTGVRITRLRLSAFGIRLEKQGVLSLGREAVVYLGGVVVNFLCVGISALFGWTTFAYIHLALGVFNLLPIGRLDGGRLLHLLLCRLGSLQHADFLQKCIGFALLTPLFAASVPLAVRGNYTLLLTACYLCVALVQGE